MNIREILRTIIGQMAAGADSWQMPWHGRNSPPRNALSGRSYSGVNRVILWSSRIENQFASTSWATFNQWRARRQPVSAGSKGTVVLQPVRSATKDELSGWRIYHVFNGDQVLRRNEGHPDLFGETASNVQNVDEVIRRTGATIRSEGYMAAYLPGTDEIHMPPVASFFSTKTSTATQNYYSTTLHELVHWTGHSTRLARIPSRDERSYAFEELVAELGASFLCSELGLETIPRPDHAQYLKGWLSELNDDPKLFVAAAGLASRAAEFVLKSSADEPDSDDSVPDWFQAQPTQVDISDFRR